ncbi:MAG: transposase [Chloroflexi bacterium]|nr:transposase [Chloroflexota bacterium]
MRLVREFLSLLEQGWKPVFAQQRSLGRAIEHAMVLPCILGRRTISREVCALGRSNQDWSADYKMFSRSRWQADLLFAPVIDTYIVRYPEGPIPVAFDDTKLAKTGKKIATAFWQRDPMSPPFHVNFLHGLRFIQASLLFPHHQEGDISARGFPVVFQEAPAIKKPGRRASEEERAAYRQARKQHNLSTQTLGAIQRLRHQLDQRGACGRILLATLDGSFCNKTIFKAALDRVHLLARCRKDARLCFPAPAGSRRRYDEQLFTPEEVRQREAVPWQEASVYYGGQRRTLRYKEVQGVLWRRGAGARPLRLIVIAPIPYKLSRHARTYYRDPAYLLSTDLHTSLPQLIQAYLDRWQIEVNHRDEKDLLGVGQAQVRSPQSVPRHPAFAVACYSNLLLAALKAFGPGRTSDYLSLPKWRKHAKRPSFLDILTLLRKECNETPVWLLSNATFAQNLVRYANT